ncbi:hypothetical protein FNF29_05009 [Cafeteria roenbergensis]|uniref:Uncharacterized protein n=1 Tax=Cafeteria roenbergensis TaxID=33653 RepID=A0A5A8CD73_CAFRO|nr:hypothetical protein FNF29_05009 [Cafeteria roenbergensis]|eukprot:KAA0150895.1 hypothetical protein FNF29_05009 [Cafeteria roenbergensis]
MAASRGPDDDGATPERRKRTGRLHAEEDAEREAAPGLARGPRRRVRAVMSPGGTAHVRVVDSDGEDAEDDSDEEEELDLAQADADEARLAASAVDAATSAE